MLTVITGIRAVLRRFFGGQDVFCVGDKLFTSGTGFRFSSFFVVVVIIIHAINDDVRNQRSATYCTLSAYTFVMR